MRSSTADVSIRAEPMAVDTKCEGAFEGRVESGCMADGGGAVIGSGSLGLDEDEKGHSDGDGML